MATLVATSPPPLNMDSVFSQGHAPPSPAYSTHERPASPLSSRTKEEPMPLATPTSSMHSSSTAASAPAASTGGQSNALLTPVLRGDASAPLRPAKDLEAFNSLLPPPIEFVEGSSSGAFAASMEDRYEPINVSPKPAAKSLSEAKATKSAPAKKAQAEKKIPSLHTQPIDLSWPSGIVHGSGLFNQGNTCFLNSALQCLLHTPPLLRILLAHTGVECRVKSGFCMSCAMRKVMVASFDKRTPFTPVPITQNLNLIAKHFRKGRQEDTHEFLRYAIDSLQKSCLAGYPPKIDHKLAETTWVHKIFGGRLRSRVTCQQCGYNSDTFDSILDLSVDIYNMNSLRDALRKFTAKDYLKGADKYKCEKCQRPVNAEKQFTIHDAPAVLTVHLKRFTPMGRKLQHPVRYDERLCLQPVMSEGQHGPTYNLYGVISHMGGGPNSGHYFAHVRGADGQWYEMNDESVGRAYRPEPLNMKNAYMLFYIREKGQALAAAVNSVGLVNGMASKKRKAQSEDDEHSRDDAVPQDMATPSFIGPLFPPDLFSKPDPQSVLLKRKIEAAVREKNEGGIHTHAQPTRPRPVKPLVEYDDYSDREEQGERIERSHVGMTQNNGLENGAPRDNSAIIPSSSPTLASPRNEPAAEDSSSPERPPPTSPIPLPSPAETIAPTVFYGSSTKRKSPDGGGLDSGYMTKENDPEDRWKGRSAASAAPLSSSRLMNGLTPYGKSRIGDNLHSARDEERELFRPRKLHKKQFGSRRKFESY